MSRLSILDPDGFLRDEVVFLDFVCNFGVGGGDDVRTLQRPFVAAVEDVAFQPAVTVSLVEEGERVHLHHFLSFLVSVFFHLLDF